MNDPHLNKVPPQNLEAEESIISAILLDYKVIEDILFLQPTDFYKQAHQIIYKACLNLFNKNKPADLVTVADELMKLNKLEDVGGATFLAQIVDTVPMASNAVHYANIVKEKSVKRQLIEKSAQITEQCFDDTSEAKKIIDFAETSIDNLSMFKSSRKGKTFGQNMQKFIDELSDKYEGKQDVTGLKTYFKKVDQYTGGLQGGDLIVLAGRPSMGKTAFAMNIAEKVAFQGNQKVSVFSLEMPLEQLQTRMFSSRLEFNSMKFRNAQFRPEEWERVVSEEAGHQGYNNIIVHDEETDLIEIVSQLKKDKKENDDLGLVIFDYLQLIDGPKSERYDLEIGKITKTIKKALKQLNIPGILLSQLARRVEQRNNKRPMLSDLRESGNIEQDADIVWFIYRDERYNKDSEDKGYAELIWAKHRNGVTGMSMLSFDGRFTKFENTDYKSQIEYYPSDE